MLDSPKEAGVSTEIDTTPVIEHTRGLKRTYAMAKIPRRAPVEEAIGGDNSSGELTERDIYGPTPVKKLKAIDLSAMPDANPRNKRANVSIKLLASEYQSTDRYSITQVPARIVQRHIQAKNVDVESESDSEPSAKDPPSKQNNNIAKNIGTNGEQSRNREHLVSVH